MNIYIYSSPECIHKQMIDLEVPNYFLGSEYYCCSLDKSYAYTKIQQRKLIKGNHCLLKTYYNPGIFLYSLHIISFAWETVNSSHILLV